MRWAPPWALADNAGTVQTSYTYEPFGGITQSGSANTNSFKYTAREDDGTGLIYYRARYYSPRLQRFLSEDPIGFDGGDANLYAYVSNNPVNFTDPLGNFAIPLPLIPLIPPAIDAGMGMLAGGMLGQIISNIINSSDARIPNNTNPEDARDSIEKAQAKHKKLGARPSIKNPADEFDGEWEGVKRKPKQNAIRDLSKSKQKGKTGRRQCE